MDIASRISFGNEEGYEILCSVDEDFESKDLDPTVTVPDGDAQEVAFTGSLFWYLRWWSGVEGSGGTGRGGEMVDDEALLFGQ